MALFSSKTSDALGKRLNSASGTLQSFVDDVQHAKTEAVATQVEAQQEIDVLQEISRDAEAIEKVADKLLNLLDIE